MNIDWDSVAQNADDSPRSILAECLSKVDEFKDVIVLVRDKDDLQRVWHCTPDIEHAIAMLALAQFLLLKEANEA